MVVSVPSITIKILVRTTKTVEETYLHDIDAKVSDNKIVACVVGKYKGYKIVRKS